MEKITLRCMSCKYKFQRYNLPDSCPFCGKKNSVVEDLETSAEELLKEVVDKN